MANATIPRATQSERCGQGVLGRSFAYATGMRYFRAALVVALSISPVLAETETIRVDLKLRSGGALSGLVVDHTSHGLVIVRDKTPYVFAWVELEGANACGVRRALMASERGGGDRLSARDFFDLGLFALQQDRGDLAVRDLAQAERLDSAYTPRVKEALDRFRSRREVVKNAESNLGQDVDSAGPAEDRLEGLTERVADELEHPGVPALAPRPTEEHGRQIMEVYRKFGRKVQEVLGKNVVLIESPHFLIWTDWERRHRDRLAPWCESMYTALCAQLHIDPASEVFLAKCPVFCFRSKARFRRFAQKFDGYDGVNAAGYTRSIEKNGHAHVVLLRTGRTERDFDRFACTLVHEGTHAFLHRLYTSRLIPHWVNEGYADLTTERVMRDRSPAAENAELLARQYVRYGWPIGELLRGSGPIEVHEYALAHSVIRYLEGLGRRPFAGFVQDLKTGATVSSALGAVYDGLTLEKLEADWRSAVAANDPRSRTGEGEPATPTARVEGSANAP